MMSPQKQAEVIGGAVLDAQSKAGLCDFEPLVDAVLDLRAKPEFEGMGVIEMGAWLNACRYLTPSIREAVGLFESMASASRVFGYALVPEKLHPGARGMYYEMVEAGGAAAARAMSTLEPA